MTASFDRLRTGSGQAPDDIVHHDTRCCCYRRSGVVVDRLRRRQFAKRFRGKLAGRPGAPDDETGERQGYRHRSARQRAAGTADYVSVNTQSLAIQLVSVNGGGVSGVNATIINTTAHARGCKVEAGGTVCTATTSGSPGQDVFAVTTYASTNATGSALSVRHGASNWG